MGIVLASLVAALAPPGPLRDLGMASYFVYDIALDLPLVWLVRAQARADREMEEVLGAAA